jgi:hypothetical protein
MEREGSSPCSQQPSTGPFPEPDEFTPPCPISILSILILFSKLCKSLLHFNIVYSSHIFLPSHFCYVYSCLGYFDLKLYLIFCIYTSYTFYILQHFNESMSVCFSQLCYILTDDERMWLKHLNRKRNIKSVRIYYCETVIILTYWKKKTWCSPIKFR